MDGNVTFWYRNGKVKASKIYKDDKLDGKYTEHRVTGTQVSSGVMVNNEMDKKWTFWYHNGQKECEVICKNGELIDGKVWDDDGNKKESLRFNLTWEGSDELQDI
jgi:antitoxin component YwqK of YwqJK toxin-antitoxin module